MDHSKLLVIYEKLWRATSAAGAFVVYRGVGDVAGEAGWFEPRLDDETGVPDPEVAVFRRPAPDPNSEPTFDRDGSPVSAIELETELHVLAHEAGHFHSFRTRGEAWRAYHAAAIARDQVVVAPEPAADFALRARAALSAQLTEKQKLLIVSEEQLAWDFGRELLRDAGLQDFSRYDESTRRGVHFHRYRLGLDELWPGEEL
ncbi:MAG: hypothetical protein JNM17_33195 [Archangium sp.]|nr:hypothetical protein [Archangium sp.]